MEYLLKQIVFYIGYLYNYWAVLFPTTETLADVGYLLSMIN